MAFATAQHELDDLAVTAIRTLAMDAVQAANSGHPGTPMAMAPVAYTLWQEFLRFDPADPIWPNRDRFVLPIGHASALLLRAAPPRGGKGGQPRLRDARRVLGAPRRPAALPAGSAPRAFAYAALGTASLGALDSPQTLAAVGALVVMGLLGAGLAAHGQRRRT